MKQNYWLRLKKITTPHNGRRRENKKNRSRAYAKAYQDQMKKATQRAVDVSRLLDKEKQNVRKLEIELERSKEHRYVYRRPGSSAADDDDEYEDDHERLIDNDDDDRYNMDAFEDDDEK